jgi:hypothetical protein
MLKEQVSERVRNLLAKTTKNGASQAEAQSAVNAAERIMAKYHLSEEDLAHEPADDYAEVDTADFSQAYSTIGRRAWQWECALARFVERFIGVPHYLRHSILPSRINGLVQLDENDQPVTGKAFVFYGVAEDAELARSVYDELRLLIAAMAVAKWGTVYKGDGGMYAEGFVSGLSYKLVSATQSEKAEAQKSIASETSTALVLIARRDDLIQYKQKKAKDWLRNEKGICLVTVSGGSGANGSSGAYSSGRRDGASTDVSNTRRRKIGS